MGVEVKSAPLKSSGTMSTTTYILGETCKWSEGDRVTFRYVDVVTVGRHRPGLRSHQVLELPEPDALALVTAMKTVNTQESSSANAEGSN